MAPLLTRRAALRLGVAGAAAVTFVAAVEQPRVQLCFVPALAHSAGTVRQAPRSDLGRWRVG